MLTQQLTHDQRDMSGKLVITAAPGALAELAGLAQELDLRDNMRTQGEIHILSSEPPPPIE